MTHQQRHFVLNRFDAPGGAEGFGWRSREPARRGPTVG